MLASAAIMKGRRRCAGSLGRGPALQWCGRPPMLGAMPTDDEAAAGADAAAGALLGSGYGATLWEPSADVIERARITDFCRWLVRERGLPLADPAGPADQADLGGRARRVYEELWRWSVTETAAFWESVWDYFGVLGHRGDGPVLTGGPMPDTQWFPGATLNYARNALRAAIETRGARRSSPAGKMARSGP